MVFKCQEDSFLKQYVSKVVSCEPSTLECASLDGVPKKLQGFNVICEDTILFPEGGGQPCDYGTINGHPVRSVNRKGSDAVHFVETSERFVEGAEVIQIVEWDRRLDHMQQHSGQHLITALFDREFKYDTTSWWLGSDTSYIELNTPHLISNEALHLIEGQANDLIRDGRKVNVIVVESATAPEFVDARAPRGLPTDHVGLVRIVHIEGIERNMCCGTHVANISQLQCIKLLYAEKGKKGSVFVHFVVGIRVMQKLDECFRRELQLNLALKGGPAHHLELIKKLQSNAKDSSKAFQKLLKELASLEAEKLEKITPRPKFYTLHRKDGVEPEFINVFLRNAPEGIFYFITVSENSPTGGKGHLVLRGDPDLVQKFGTKFMELLDGKGNGKENNFQGKINNTNKIPECNALLEEHYAPVKIKSKT